MFVNQPSIRTFSILAVAVSLAGLGGAHPSKAARDALPIVDLGYELHQAASFNETGGFYNFSNIRYAAPPLGNLRFAIPKHPAKDRSTVQTGSVGRVCPQANPAWEAIAAVAVPEYLLGVPFNTSQTFNTTSSAPTIDPRTTEDCLFLDVVAPKSVFENAHKHARAAVLVWIYGGGYTAGEKSDAQYNPSGLLNASEAIGDVVFVSLNYRLGAFGWSSGPKFQSQGGVNNLGLYDQRLALEWVQKNIHKFGGNKHRVTVMGESAGGGSILHQITAFGGKHGVPFHQAIPQSPGFFPTTSLSAQDATYAALLAATNTSSLAELRAVPEATLIRANILTVGGAPYGLFTYGPVASGTFTPGLPSQLLAKGRFHRSVRLLTGHNADEGLLFASPYATIQSAYEALLRRNFADITAAAVSYVADVLYPPVYNGSYGYKDDRGRVAVAEAESSFTCNNVYLAHAFKNRSYAYEFTTPPSIHGQDVPYTFWNGGAVAAVLNVTVARALQETLLSFVVKGKPSGVGVYGKESEVLKIGSAGVAVGKDDVDAVRCQWWGRGAWREGIRKCQMAEDSIRMLWYTIAISRSDINILKSHDPSAYQSSDLSLDLLLRALGLAGQFRRLALGLASELRRLAACLAAHLGRLAACFAAHLGRFAARFAAKLGCFSRGFVALGANGGLGGFCGFLFKGLERLLPMHRRKDGVGRLNALDSSIRNDPVDLLERLLERIGDRLAGSGRGGEEAGLAGN
ncbi:alpha/beta-hydrolase [Lophium mytilinum]|uniref:Alpha/beta-hydrolase n=1 Tax=Lophium mytilinum TaxID=390894 RepID=A0A6A6RAL4_9PEZI|nr:alpha/beta-hydrolase [Lophium mytilinum]